MRNDKDFISDHLVNIRDRLKVYSKETAGEESAPAGAAASSGRQDPPAAKPAEHMESSAVKRRIAEALKSRNDLQELLAGDIAYIRQRIQLETEQLQELETAEENIRNTPAAPAGSTPAEAGAYFRCIEEIRLDYIRCLAKYSQRQGEQQISRPRENTGFPNYFAGQMKAGMAFHLFLGASIIAAAIITGVFFFVAVNGGF